jgi:hypothetical protein
VATSVHGHPLATAFDVPSCRPKSALINKLSRIRTWNNFCLVLTIGPCSDHTLPNMRISALLVPIGLSSLVATQTYVLEDDHEPASFFDMFDFFTVSKYVLIASSF